ncbi:hypothetical protein KC853_03165 [Candidatus Saccharibacteria bacterium]|nr:hypothetical protein [Candidatus Saccharibacteria bacterium]
MEQTNKYQPVVTANISDLMVRLGLDNLDDQKQQELILGFAEVIQTRVTDMVIDRLSDQQLNELDLYVDSDDIEGAQAYIEANIPDYQQFVLTVVAEIEERVNAKRVEFFSAVEQTKRANNVFSKIHKGLQE